ncbi:uncharacterized protein LOC124622723 [Schistocerca americana]|uniref:uncharacterized protein LOC124622723 n=1 Tax=Schistocerca americana TaxID=7009 RepID=UPI001F501C15|nr:uncharacterized protein LOC124622723 [Schistocerca americana]
MLRPAGVLLLLLACLAAPRAAHDHDHDRHRRALVFGNNGVLQLTLGIGIPLNIPNRRASMGYALQAQFSVPVNASQLEPLLAARGGRRGARALYRRLEEAAGDARCLLRAVCHAAAEPLHAAGLLEELLTLLLTPSEDADDDGDSELAEYLAAQRLGASGGDCGAAYGACAESPLDAFSQRIEPWEWQGDARPDL